MINRIICFFTKHRWGRWKYVKCSGRYDDVLKKTCKRCNKVEFYKGITETSITGDKVPYRKQHFDI